MLISQLLSSISQPMAIRAQLKHMLIPPGRVSRVGRASDTLELSQTLVLARVPRARWGPGKSRMEVMTILAALFATDLYQFLTFLIFFKANLIDLIQLFPLVFTIGENGMDRSRVQNQVTSMYQKDFFLRFFSSKTKTARFILGFPRENGDLDSGIVIFR